MGYRVLAGIDYPPNKRAEIGDVIDDLAPQSIKWLLSAGVIEDSSKSPQVVAEEPKIIEEPVVEETIIEEPVVEAEGFDPNAKDGDGDGFLQDGTPHQRPVEEE